MLLGDKKSAPEEKQVKKRVSTAKVYDQWSATYDGVENKTRDMEKHVCERLLAGASFDTVLEIGGGTGKNTAWLASRASRVTSVDLSVEMQARAKGKITTDNVRFAHGDIRGAWKFLSESVDLITCSLVLEHVEDLGHVFRNAFRHLKSGGSFYVCELHPFKQYEGSKAKFEADGKVEELDCYIHHITDYTAAAAANGFSIGRIDEWFDNDDRVSIPRLISFLFKRGT